MEPYAEPVLDVPELSASWYVALSQESLEPRRGINELRSKVIPALAELEQRGMDDFRRDEMREFRILWGEQVRAPLLMDGLPVNSAQRGDPDPDEPKIYLIGPADGSIVSAENTHSTIEEALASPRLEGERRKLDGSGREERHLFVWVGTSLYAAHVGIASEDEPADARPILPSEITHLWVAAEGTEGPVVWTSTGDQWVRRVVKTKP